MGVDVIRWVTVQTVIHLDIASEDKKMKNGKKKIPELAPDSKSSEDCLSSEGH